MSEPATPPDQGGRGDGRRRFYLCADDYGISPGVNAAIRDLVARGRLNATSVMTASPGVTEPEAAALALLNSDRSRVAIGLHFTLTAPFRPLSRDYAPLRDGAFLPLAASLSTGLRRRFKPAALEAEIRAQMQAFDAAFGRPPDFVDGHQHVQLFPQVRDAVLKVMAEMAPGAWVRQCGRPDRPILSWQRLRHDRKAWLLDLLSREFRRRAACAGIRTNPAFAGVYDFAPQADFAALFPGFIAGLDEGSVVMCHPGLVDDALRQLDPLTDLREREYAYLAGDAFPQALAAQRLALA